MLKRLLVEAASGRPPAADGQMEICGPPDSPAQAVLAFTAHHVVATGADPAWVWSALDPDDVGAAMAAPFLTALATHLGARSGTLDAVLAAWPTGVARGDLGLVEGDVDHPRVTRARRYRRDLRCYTDGAGGLLGIGAGLAGRTEVFVEVDEDARRRGRGAALAGAALSLLPEGEPVFAQVTPGNVASLRCFLAAGYRPIGAEMLFLRS